METASYSGIIKGGNSEIFTLLSCHVLTQLYSLHSFVLDLSSKLLSSVINLFL